MCHRKRRDALCQRPVIKSAMIFHPSRMSCVLMQMLRADVMVLSFDHAA
jgi:hypothetical protein